MKIKIATWNMAYWQYKKYFEEAWDYYLKKIDADIIFFKKQDPQREFKMIRNILFGMKLAAIVPGAQVYIVKNTS